MMSRRIYSGLGLWLIELYYAYLHYFKKTYRVRITFCRPLVLGRM